ncbi:hypothetical protein VVD49_08835 [Uliginosibacterium sp. H3]|uniref:Cytochrome C oxidase subunit I n=1 Tax=Uliginosibacterium silvisoli TaxID=3114758 RepID=A0ABU6K438_9RHOO|nr:hypothetical protein [Uliginosibacterium sp. H3]
MKSEQILSPAAPTAEQVAKGRRTLVLLFLVCLAPVLAAYGAFYVWRPSAQASYGKVVSPPVALPVATLKTLDGAPLVEGIRGKWTLAVRAPSACDPACQQELYYTRQIRTITGANMDRVARLWVFDDARQPEAKLLADHPGLLVVSDPALASAVGPAGQIALIDPRGNLMMRFPENAEPKGIVKDLQKLLKYSR